MTSSNTGVRTDPPTAMLNDPFLTAYVDLPFLERFFREKPEEEDLTSPDDWPTVWQNVYRFLKLSATVVFDVEEEPLRSEDLIARFLGGQGRKHRDNIKFQPEVFQSYTDPDSVEIANHPHSIFLLESPEVPTEELRERKGLAFLKLEDLKVHWSRLFEEHSLNVFPEARLSEGKNEFGWADLKTHAVPLNALVIADKFAYMQFRNKERFRQNLGELLLILLPETLDHPVHLTLVTDLEASLEKDFDPDKGDWPHPKDIREDIRAYLGRNRPELDVRLGVVGYNDHGHKDRFIFTNYGLFTSNDSFSFFKNGRLDKETLVTYLPSSTHGSGIVEPRLERMAKYLDNLSHFNTARYKSGPDKKILLADGDDQNRLLDASAIG